MPSDWTGLDDRPGSALPYGERATTAAELAPKRDELLSDQPQAARDHAGRLASSRTTQTPLPS
jgi:hypothetical protein